MTKKEAKKLFVEEFFEDRYNLQRALDDDYLAVNLIWGGFIDTLCKDGVITLRQYETWTFPWHRER